MKKNNFSGSIWPAITLLLPALPLQLYFAGNWYSFWHSYSLGMACGIVAYIWFCLTLILAGRIRYFDRVYGHDRVLIFHGYLARAAIGFALAHFVFKYMFHSEFTIQSSIGLAALLLFGMVAALTVLFMVDGILSQKRALQKSQKLKRFWDYSRLKCVHNLTAAAFACTVVHILIASSTAETNIRMQAMGGMGVFSLGVYCYHKIIRGWQNNRAGTTVSAVSQPDHTVMRLQLNKLPAKLVHSRAGQFCYFRFISAKCGKEEHPFTLSSPVVNQQSDLLIKAVGDYTQKLSEIEPGTRVHCDGPYGHFTPEPNIVPLLFIAGGIGITPFMAIVSSWNTIHLQKPVTLIWSTATENDMIQRAVFDTFAEKNTLFTFVPVVTRPAGASPCAGRINKKLLGSHYTKEMHVYLCASARLRKAVMAILRELGTPERMVYRERFG
ncbi:MAG: hypothetical protein GF350_09750 [Chitinivibrionales bacterium]|nr:hypothetical protein [Chitinivibrionales bacterium]